MDENVDVPGVTVAGNRPADDGTREKGIQEESRTGT